MSDKDKWVAKVIAINVIATAIVSLCISSFVLSGSWYKVKEWAEHGEQAYQYLFVKQHPVQP